MRNHKLKEAISNAAWILAPVDILAAIAVYGLKEAIAISCDSMCG
ncbi:MAG: hypothetical protein RMY34_19390 [Aulosira sp. DedQUE10]|nr:hypothetical protein [Aulosira sp. DedQUE10]